MQIETVSGNLEPREGLVFAMDEIAGRVRQRDQHAKVARESGRRFEIDAPKSILHPQQTSVLAVHLDAAGGVLDNQ